MEQWYKCPRCNQNLVYGTNPCPYCKCSLAWSQQGPVLYIPPIEALQQQAGQQPVEAQQQQTEKKAKSLKTISIIIGLLAVFFIGVCSICLNSSSSKTAAPKTASTPDVNTQSSLTQPTPTPTPTIDAARDRMIAIFKANAQSKWGSDYEMVKYELDNQTEAYDWVVENAKDTNIVNRAKQKWGNDYEMVKYEYENQAGAYKGITQQTSYPQIMNRAKQKWGTDYEMVKYEYNNQVKAYEWINQQTSYPQIMSTAKQKWGDDYEMVKYEYENQVKAYKILR